MNILMFNGLLFLLFMWTSAEMGAETEHTEGLQAYANESRVNILARKRACENLDGKCIKTKKDCPSNLHLETKPGRPFCSKNHRCCYPGPSCNLVWDYKEERPLIMIRESKTIVPPVTDIDVSDNPNRIPIGRKLIFACPGENNQFNHVEGIHTELYGECISHDQFKVCVNNKPEILDLSQLSCSSRMFPSFIKDTDSSVKSCDGIGGELYKTGYTYGDYHEFKDLDIEVCFHEKNPSTLCTSPNINGNETDYKTSRGFLTSLIEERKEISKRMDRLCGEGGGGGNPCILDWVVGTPAFPPLILDLDANIVLPVTKDLEREATVRILDTEVRIFTCSQTKFVNYNVHHITAKCTKGKLRDENNMNEIYEWGKMGCKVQILPTTIQKMTTTTAGKGVPMTCFDKTGFMWQIGFDAGSLFYDMIDVCFDKSRKTTIFTIHLLHGESILAREKLREPEKEFPKNEIKFFSDIKMKHIYNPTTQWEYFKKMTYPKIINPKEEFKNYFSKGHMAPRSDFIVKAMQDATYTYINALPQWVKFNRGNWKLIEEEIQKLAEKLGDTYTIVTAEHDSPLKLDKDIYLGDPEVPNNKIPVPGVMLKAVWERNIVFISYNDPTLLVNPTPECTDMCDLVVWLSDKTVKRLKDPKYGLIYCCSIKELLGEDNELEDMLKEMQSSLPPQKIKK